MDRYEATKKAFIKFKNKKYLNAIKIIEVRVKNGNTTWIDTLKKMGNNSKKAFTQRQAKSWVHSNFLNRDDETNVFEEVDKVLDLNSDAKRVWLSKTTGKQLINGIEESIPQYVGIVSTEVNMSEVIIDNVSYNSEDKIRSCHNCPGDFYDAPSLVNFIELTTSQQELFDAALLGFAVCPECNLVEVWEGINKEFVN